MHATRLASRCLFVRTQLRHQRGGAEYYFRQWRLRRGHLQQRGFEHLEQLEPEVEKHMQGFRYADALRSLAGVRDRVDAFFDKVLVNADDPKLRSNRLGLLTRLNRLMNQVADISKLAT